MTAEWNRIVQPVSDGCTMRCRVQPRSSRNAVIGIYDNSMKIALTAPPVDGEANAMLCAFIAKLLGISRSMVSVKQGATAKNKVLVIRGISVEAAQLKLEELTE